MTDIPHLDGYAIGFAAGQEAMREEAARALCWGCGKGYPRKFIGDKINGFWTHVCEGGVVAIRNRCMSGPVRGIPVVSAPSPWRPIGEAPKDGTRIIGLTVYGPEIVKWSAYGEWIGTEQDSTCLPSGVTRGDAQHQPTHWMPLPAPPSNEDR